MNAQAVIPSRNPEWWREAPPPGLHRGVPYDEYARWAAINHSVLRKIKQSPLHARHAMLNPDDSTAAQAFGSALHKAVLEPDLFPKVYAWAPKFDKRTNAGKEGWAKFQAENPGKEYLTKEEYEKCIAMRDAVWSHPTAAEILRAPGVNELSAVWKDKETETVCKGRQDRFGSWDKYPTVVDLKSTVDASKKAFSRAIENYGYAEQAAMYLDGFETLAPFEGDRRYVLIAAENEPPYAVAVYELDSDAIEVGRKRYRGHLIQYARSLESGVWSGYGDGLDLISLPPWSMKAEE